MKSKKSIVIASALALSVGAAFGQEPATNNYVSKQEYEQLKADHERLEKEFEALKAQLQRQGQTASAPAAPATNAPAAPAAQDLANKVQQLQKQQADQQSDTAQSLDQIETEMRNLAAKTKAAIPGSTKMLLAGYGAATFQAARGNFSPLQPYDLSGGDYANPGKSAFLVGFNPLFLWNLAPKTLFEGELETQYGPGSRGVNVNLEQAQVVYELNDYIDVGAGAFLDPMNYFVERQHMWWIDPLPDRPLAVYDGLVPETMTGVQARGGIPLGPTKFEYAFFAAMAPSLPNVDLNAAHAALGALDYDNYGSNYHIDAGGRVGFFPIPQLELGYGFQVFKADPLAADGSSLGSGVDTLLQSADFNWVQDAPWLKGRVELRGEWIWSHLDNYTGYLNVPAGIGPFSNNRNGGYGQLTYRPTKLDNKFIQNLEGVFRFDRIDELHTPIGLEDNRYTVGLDYWLAPSTVVKLAYEWDRQHNWSESPYGVNPAMDGSAFLMQFAIGF